MDFSMASGAEPLNDKRLGVIRMMSMRLRDYTAGTALRWPNHSMTPNCDMKSFVRRMFLRISFTPAAPSRSRLRSMGFSILTIFRSQFFPVFFPVSALTGADDIWMFLSVSALSNQAKFFVHGQ
jgi:hypothetical protein